MRLVGRLLFAIGLLGASGCGRIAFDLLVLASGAWNDATCDPTMRPYACERD